AEKGEQRDGGTRHISARSSAAPLEAHLVSRASRWAWWFYARGGAAVPGVDSTNLRVRSVAVGAPRPRLRGQIWPARLAAHLLILCGCPRKEEPDERHSVLEEAARRGQGRLPEGRAGERRAAWPSVATR